MQITIKTEVFKKFHPKLRIAFIQIDNFNNKKLKQSQKLLQETAQLIQLTFNKETVKNHHLISPWKVAKEEGGKKPKHYHTSVEQLIHKTLKNKKIATKNTLTNLVNYLSLKYIIPMNIDDLNKIKGNLAFSAPNKENLNYSDKEKKLGTKIGYWKNPKTNLKNSSTSALIHIETIPPVTPKELNEIVKETEKLIKEFCGGEIKTFILSKKNNTKKI